MKLGIMQGRLLPREIKYKMQSFPWKDWEKEFKILSINKLRNLEWTLDSKNFYKNPINTEKGIKKIIRLKKKYKININSITCDFFMQSACFKKKNTSKFKKILIKIKHLINNAKEIKIKYLIFPLVDNSSIKNSLEEKKLINILKNVETDLIQNKMMILFESDYSPQKLRLFMSKFDKKIFGINYDSGNSACLNYRFDDEMINYKYIKNIHLKDRKIKGKSVRFGFGDVDFKKILNFLKKKKYNGNLIFQSFLPVKKDPILELLYNFNYIERLISDKKN